MENCGSFLNPLGDKKSQGDFASSPTPGKAVIPFQLLSAWAQGKGEHLQGTTRRESRTGGARLRPTLLLGSLSHRVTGWGVGGGGG